MDDTALHQNIVRVRNRLSDAACAANRDVESIRLIAVSKTKSVREIQAVRAAGQLDFGENYVAEAVEKIKACDGLGICWHFLGPLQSNKTHWVAQHFDWVHSIDRLKIASRLHHQRPDHLPPLQVCLQVNIPAEPTKSGISSESELLDLAASVAEFDRLALRGLMAIPSPTDDIAQQRKQFRRIAELLRVEGLPDSVNELSMGMSGDMEAAIAESATMVRIGTDIFGARYT